MRFAKLTVAVLTVLIFSLFMAQDLLAQTSSISGTIIDTDGKKVPYVNVTATNTSTGEDKVAITGDAGTYKIDGLAPGNYKVSMSVQGFVMPEVPNLTLGATESKQLNFTLMMTSYRADGSQAPGHFLTGRKTRGLEMSSAITSTHSQSLKSFIYSD